jgi:ribonuclease P protein component
VTAVLTFRRRHRLTHAREFQRVYDNRIRKSEGPLLVSIAPNELAEHRLGLSVGRRVGPAVVRTRAKRMIRESFRLARAGFPKSDSGNAYDIVVGVRPHDPIEQQAYQAILVRLIEQGHQVCQRRAGRAERESAERDRAEGGHT